MTGPHSGYFGVGSVLLLTIVTWGLLWTLHVRLWRDPINPMSPNERSTSTQVETAHHEQTGDIPQQQH